MTDEATRVRVTTASPLESAAYREQWKEFANELGRRGFTVVFDELEEQRGGPLSVLLPPDWPDGATVRLVIDASEMIATEALDSLVETIIAALLLYLKGRLVGQRHARVAVIVDEHGRPIRRVKLPDDVA